ncbi:MAG TPA: hypothetical protein VHC50_12500 [Puia sp.]|nr:hypothetical protein [Puia sp.]
MLAAIQSSVPVGRTALITGLPRAGTTLLASLLNRLPDCIALVEPMDARHILGHQKQSEMVESIAAFLEAQRHSILQQGIAISFHASGQMPDNFFGDQRDVSGKRILSGIKRGKIKVTKKLPDDFLLIVKDNTSFTALLQPLAQRFAVYAIIRHPLAVLASWHSVSLPVGNGHVPMAEAIDGKLASELAALDDVVARQIHILNWFFAKFLATLPASHIVPYETIISTGGKVLSVINPLAITLDEKLGNRNQNKLYDQTVMRGLHRRLINTDGACWQFYDRESMANFPV